MNTIELRQTIHQEIDHLSEEQLNQVLQFIQQVGNDQDSDLCEPLSISVADDWSDFIGSMEAEPDLSSNYKSYLNQELGEKYDYR